MWEFGDREKFEEYELELPTSVLLIGNKLRLPDNRIVEIFDTLYDVNIATQIVRVFATF